LHFAGENAFESREIESAVFSVFSFVDCNGFAFVLKHGRAGQPAWNLCHALSISTSH
jgi:hypothetical protein